MCFVVAAQVLFIRYLKNFNPAENSAFGFSAKRNHLNRTKIFGTVKEVFAWLRQRARGRHFGFVKLAYCARADGKTTDQNKN